MSTPALIRSVMERHQISQVKLGIVTGSGTRLVQNWLRGRNGRLVSPTEATQRLLRLLDDHEIGGAVLAKLWRMEDER